jgi:hypothetical protein
MACLIAENSFAERPVISLIIGSSSARLGSETGAHPVAAGRRWHVPTTSNDGGERAMTSRVLFWGAIAIMFAGLGVRFALMGRDSRRIADRLQLLLGNFNDVGGWYKALKDGQKFHVDKFMVQSLRDLNTDAYRASVLGVVGSVLSAFAAMWTAVFH